jgi:mRNA interferase RelE/StbE
VSYAVTVLPRAKRELSKINSPYFEALSEKLASLKENPRPHGCKKLQGRNGWRIRVGEYRKACEIDDTEKSVVVLSVGHRKDIYD